MSPLNIVVGITGGIAAYKAVGVVRALVLAGHDVHVVATEAALRFVGRPTLEAISRNPVHTDLYEGVAEVRHVAIGQAADLIVIAPATANTIAKLADGPRRRPARQHVLASDGAARHRARRCTPRCGGNPATGRTSRRCARAASRRRPRQSGSSPAPTRGPGRMAEPDDIVAAALERAVGIRPPRPRRTPHRGHRGRHARAARSRALHRQPLQRQAGRRDRRGRRARAAPRSR